ncbi:LAMI_0C06216g1_1 [Lachancea mirantina]|uniref:LAMI_0C06216g1_1 n=1 Tax=Lachancea mirantina TaxID=1230905 RepID=A0A1G4J351_9SACH|nr:LAMI_0C06216g1_1 [Lachancea mirantina]
MQLYWKRNLHSHMVANIKKRQLPPRPKFSPDWETELEEKFLHGGRGPGGQKINKCNSKVQLRHLPSGIVVECQETRSRDQNRKIAREKLALKISQWQNDGIAAARNEAMHQWGKQSKRSKEKKSREKHVKHRALRDEQELERIQEEQRLLELIRNGE